MLDFLTKLSDKHNIPIVISIETRKSPQNIKHSACFLLKIIEIQDLIWCKQITFECQYDCIKTNSNKKNLEIFLNITSDLSHHTVDHLKIDPYRMSFSGVVIQ
jgi:hypothetical protein